MTHRFLLDGQPVVYNAETKIGKTTIEEPFIKAGKVLGWGEKFSSPGIGLNFEVCNFIMKRQAVLIVHVSNASKDYWIKWDHIAWCIENLNTKYNAGGHKWVHVIPWSEFNRKMELLTVN